MAKIKELKVRPFSNASQERTDWRGQANIVVNLDVLADLKLKDGGICTLQKGADGVSREVIVNVTKEKLSKTVVQMSRALQRLCDVKTGETIILSASPTGPDLPVAESVILTDVTPKSPDSPQALRIGDARAFVASLQTNTASGLAASQVALPGIVFSSYVSTLGKRSFEVSLVNGRSDAIARYDHLTTTVRISASIGSNKDSSASARDTQNPEAGTLQIAPILALERQVKFLNGILKEFGKSDEWEDQPVVSCGLVLDGPSGSGKSMVLQRILETGWGGIHKILTGEPASSIREKFARARERQPSIVAIEDFNTENSAVISALNDSLDQLSRDYNTLGYKPNVLVIVTCKDYVGDLPATLRTATRFFDVVSLDLPNDEGRKKILQHKGIKLDPAEKDKCLEFIIDKTFGWSVGDLNKLCRAAHLNIIRRRAEKEGDEEQGSKYLTFEDISKARELVRPATMEGYDHRPPKISWNDIGGQEELKKSLQVAVNMMIDSNSLIKPPRGLLLYGPPGCSKTMAAQAMANAARCNFFSVKGGELLNMYVGESERNVRQLFERARRAAPSIIFFDEIDGLGSGRAHIGQATSGGNLGGSGIKIIEALLTEIDGFDTGSGVLIVGATNRPDLIDSALLRPGRIDRRHYVGPPDEEARLEIFKRIVRENADKVDEDVIRDVENLAQLTEGLSGAEVVQVWNEACFMVVEEGMDMRFSDDERRQERKMRLVNLRDIKKAIEKMPRQITKQMLRGFEAWEKEFDKQRR